MVTNKKKMRFPPEKTFDIQLFSTYSNIRGSTVNSFEDGGIATNVTGRSQTETTDQTSAHVRQDVTVQVRHDHDGFSVERGVGGDLIKK
jgi:hypothetical protein